MLISKKVDKAEKVDKTKVPAIIKKLKAKLKEVVKNLDFEQAIEIRDQIAELEKEFKL